MRSIYIDCGMGAAGDMLTAALLALHPAPEAFLERMNAVLAGKAALSAARVCKCGVECLHVTVSINGDEEGEELRHDHRHTSIGEIREFLKTAPVSERVREDALQVYDLLAGAEAAVHGAAMENVHFHEVGSIDALADVLSVCTLMEELAPERVFASPVNVGGGMVRCAHGVLPVPAPATERLLRGVPYYEGEIQSELCTPTGAALLRHFVDEFGAMPPMEVEGAGYGAGKKDFGALNAVRILLGETKGPKEQLVELCCNLDDCTAEELGFATEELFAAGALDVWTTPIGMKKSRPGVLLSCLCHAQERGAVLRCLFRHTSTLGVRETVCGRYTLERSFFTAPSAYGDVRMKRSAGYGVVREKPEYEDLARMAREQGLSLREIKESIR